MGLYTGKAYFQNIYDRHAVSYSNPKTCTLNHQHQYENADNAIISVLATWGVKRHHFRFRSTWSMVPFPVHVVNGSVSGPRGQWFRFRSMWSMVPFPVHVVNGSVSGPRGCWFRFRSTWPAVTTTAPSFLFPVHPCRG